MKARCQALEYSPPLVELTGYICLIVEQLASNRIQVLEKALEFGNL